MLFPHPTALPGPNAAHAIPRAAKNVVPPPPDEIRRVYGDPFNPRKKEQSGSLTLLELPPVGYKVYVHRSWVHGPDRHTLDLTPTGPCSYCLLPASEFPSGRFHVVVNFDPQADIYTLKGNCCSPAHAIGTIVEDRGYDMQWRKIWQHHFHQHVLGLDLTNDSYYWSPPPRHALAAFGGHITHADERRYMQTHRVRLSEGTFISHGAMVEAAFHIAENDPDALVETGGEEFTAPPATQSDAAKASSGTTRLINPDVSVWNIRGLRAPVAPVARAVSATNFADMVRGARIGERTEETPWSLNYAEQGVDAGKTLFDQFQSTDGATIHAARTDHEERARIDAERKEVERKAKQSSAASRKRAKQQQQNVGQQQEKPKPATKRQRVGYVSVDATTVSLDGQGTIEDGTPKIAPAKTKTASSKKDSGTRPAPARRSRKKPDANASTASITTTPSPPCARTSNSESSESSGRTSTLSLLGDLFVRNDYDDDNNNVGRDMDMITK